MASSKQVTESVSDNDRLITVLQSCFSELMRNQEEQTERLMKKQEEETEKLHKAVVEALKPHGLTTDTKPAFWTSYMKVADEHDKEFQQKYSTDLDVSLIFAGLFSAVSSAFIILIQPQLQLSVGAPTTIIVAVQGLLYTSLFTTLLAALLAVLGKQWVMHYQAAGSRGTIEERGLERQRKLDGLRKWKLDMVLQMFPLLLQLALLLFSSALSIYLWPIHRSIAGLVMGITVFGFGSYILLLASAIVVPDSPFQTPLASFLKQMFTPASKGFGKLGRGYPHPYGRRRHLSLILTKLRRCTMQVRSLLAKSRTWILPSLMQRNVDRPPWEMFPDHYLSPASPEIPAIQWLIETSTDPLAVTAAAEKAAGLQWPLDLDFSPVIDRLTDIFASCFQVKSATVEDVLVLQAGMAHRAIDCGMVLVSLIHIARISIIHIARNHQPRPTRSWQGRRLETQETLSPTLEKRISNILRILGHLTDHPRFDIDIGSANKWEWYILVLRRNWPFVATLREFLDQIEGENVPSLDLSVFADYLCYIHGFFGLADPRILADIDKRRLIYPLISQLFKALKVTTVDASLIARVINITARLANNSNAQGVGRYLRMLRNDFDAVMRHIPQFCNHFSAGSDSLQVFVSAASLARYHWGVQILPQYKKTNPQPAEWIYPALEFVQRQWEEKLHVSGDATEWDITTTVAVQNLLQFLAFSDTLRPPSLASLHIIVQALFTRGDVSIMASMALCRSPSWFRNSSLQPVLQSASVWAQLGRIAREHISFRPDYLDLGEAIVDIPQWKPILRADLSTWVTAFSNGLMIYRDGDVSQVKYTTIFMAVIRSLWVPKLGDREQLLDHMNGSWILTITALSNVWETVEFSPAPRECLSLARCTLSASLRVDYQFHHPRPVHHNIRTIFSGQLGKSLTQAAARAKNTVVPSLSQGSTSSAGLLEIPFALDRLAGLLHALGQKLSTEFEPTGGEVVLGGVTKRYGDWEELRRHFEAEIDALEAKDITT